MNEELFWSMIEDAWHAAGGMTKTRQQLAQGSLSEESAEELVEALDEVIPLLTVDLEQLGEADLLAFDQILESKLYEIDRAEVQEHTDGSDDGFLYARGFIVAAGRDYFDAVNCDPSVAMMDLECEEICYLSWHLFHDQFGDVPTSGISRETGSNTSGWPQKRQFANN